MNCKLSIQFLRILFAVMLFQFLAPAFLTAFALEPQVSQATLHSSHDSFNFPVYLKEKDEHELSEGRQQDLALPILIDFSCIPEALTQIHEVRFLPVVHDHRFNYYPPLHKLNCSYLI